MRMLVRSLFFGLLALWLTACGSDEARPYAGKLVTEVSLALPDGTAGNLTPDQRAALEAEGGKVDDSRNALVFPRQPLQGRFIKAGDGYYLSDPKGLFHIPSLPSSVTELEVFRDTQGDAARLTVFPVNGKGYEASDEKAPEHVMTEDLPIPGEMNPDTALPEPNPLHKRGELHLPGEGHQHPKVLADGCQERCDADAADAKGNKVGCCQDYDGLLGDKLPRYRDDPSLICKAKAYKGFPNSICAKWSTGQIGTACQNEAAYRCLNPKNSQLCGKNTGPTCTSGSGCADGTICLDGHCSYPSCFKNHHWRNCQNMDPKALSVTPQATVLSPGGSVTLSFTNNTEANEAQISGIEDGQSGSLKVLDAGPTLNGQFLKQYDDNQKKHYETVKLRYTAPKPPKGQCFTPGKKVVLSFLVANSASGGATTVSAVITIKSPGKLMALGGNPSAGGVGAPSMEDECDPEEVGSDVLTVDDTAREWAEGDAIAPGPGTVTVTTGSIDTLAEELIDLTAGPIDSGGHFSFTLDCTNAGGPCTNAKAISKACGGSLTPSSDTMKWVTLDVFLIDSLFAGGVHARVGGGLFLTPQPPRETLGALVPGTFYTWIWADQKGTVLGGCQGVPFSLNLKRGWNPVRRDSSGYQNGSASSDVPWYFFNTLTAGP